MKKAIILLCTVLIIEITGCGNTQSNMAEGNKDKNNGNDLSAPMNPASETKDDETVQNDMNEQTFINGIISDYTIARTSFGENADDIKIFFPAVKGLSDEAKQGKINDLIRNAALMDTQGGYRPV